MPFRRHGFRIEQKIKNNTLVRNYESSKILQQYYKLFSKDLNNKSYNNYADISSIQLSESHADKDVRFLFNRKKESDKKVRWSHQLDDQKLKNFRLKEDNKKNTAVRYSMFNPKSTVIIYPMRKLISHQVGNTSNNVSNILSSNGDFGNNDDNKMFDSFNNSNKDIFKNRTLIDNRDNKNINLIANSFAELSLYELIPNHNTITSTIAPIALTIVKILFLFCLLKFSYLSISAANSLSSPIEYLAFNIICSHKDCQAPAKKLFPVALDKAQ
jgi:hypothetical protein